MLMIRLSRRGARKQPYYRVVVIEKDRARNGRSIEVVGTYNPRTNPASVLLKKDRIEHWTNAADMGAHAMHSLQNYRAPEPQYDGNIKSYSNTYHPGTATLQLYGHHTTPPQVPGWGGKRGGSTILLSLGDII